MTTSKESKLVTHPKSYILQAIVGHKSNGYSSFGELHAKHVEDIAKLLENYGIGVAENVLARVATGEIKIKKERKQRNKIQNNTQTPTT